jgi:hypothetical protein
VIYQFVGNGKATAAFVVDRGWISVNVIREPDDTSNQSSVHAGGAETSECEKESARRGCIWMALEKLRNWRVGADENHCKRQCDTRHGKGGDFVRREERERPRRPKLQRELSPPFPGLLGRKNRCEPTEWCAPAETLVHPQMWIAGGAHYGRKSLGSAANSAWQRPRPSVDVRNGVSLEPFAVEQ